VRAPVGKKRNHRAATTGNRWWSLSGLRLLQYGLLLALLLPSQSWPETSVKLELEGSPFRGRKLLSDKLCTQCHSVWGHGGDLGPEISTAVIGKNWLDLVGDFWNHTPTMIDAMADSGHSWPTLSRGEMADLLSYLYYLRLFDQPGDPARGSNTYVRLRCVSCHTLGGEGERGGVPLDRFSSYPSPVMLAQAMWNAGAAMQREQLGRGTGIPIFSKGAMADIQAHIREKGDRGDRPVALMELPDPVRGAEVFKSKHCAACHESASGSGPDLAVTALDLTVSEVSEILWNHSYEMSADMRSRGIKFPRFAGTQMADLISYLYLRSFFRDKGDAALGEGLFRERGCVRCHAGKHGSAPDLTLSKAAADPIGLSAAMWNHSPEMHALMAKEAVAWPTFEPGEMAALAAYLRKVSATE
jgi:cytochrome c2